MDAKRFAIRLKMHKVRGGVVHHCALFQRALETQGFKTRVVKGVCLVPRTREVCEHYWVQTEDGLNLDLGYEVGCLYSPELRLVETMLLPEAPEGFATPDSDPENTRLFDLYQKDPKTFWLETPHDVRSFK